MEKYNRNLKSIRLEKGLKQKEIAEILGITVRQYQNFELGKSNPTLDKIVKLAEYYNVSVDYLIGRTKLEK